MVHNYAQWCEKSLESNNIRTLEMLKCSSGEGKQGSISPAEMHSVLKTLKKSHFLTLPAYRALFFLNVSCLFTIFKVMSAVCLHVLTNFELESMKIQKMRQL